jgi:hypothetical protein
MSPRTHQPENELRSLAVQKADVEYFDEIISTPAKKERQRKRAAFPYRLITSINAAPDKRSA